VWESMHANSLRKDDLYQEDAGIFYVCQLIIIYQACIVWALSENLLLSKKKRGKAGNKRMQPERQQHIFPLLQR
jgi:hypothetical protein